VQVKGRAEAVEVFQLDALADEGRPRSQR